MRRSAFVLVSMLSFGCGQEAPVPDKPTWAEDVAPILRGQCFQCHGPTANWMRFRTKRWDVLDMTAPPVTDLGFSADPVTWVSGNDPIHFAGMIGFITATDETQRMPPPPALPLTAREIEVLTKWSENNFEAGKHGRNAKPTLGWLNKQQRMFVVSDANQDQVLGKLDCDGTEVSINRSGGHKLPEGAATTCAGKLFDGFEEVDVSLR
jgi:hypothetical protein